MLIGFAGLKGSGKDTAAQVLIDEFGFTKVCFADALREMLSIIDPPVWADPDNVGQLVRLSDVVEQFGWDFAKRTYPEVRRLMQVTGTEAVRGLFGENAWVDVLAYRYPDLGSVNTRYVITDCRFTNEADFVDSKGGSIVWIARPGLVSDGHASESAEMRKYRNWEIINDGSLADLRQQVVDIMISEGVDPVD